MENVWNLLIILKLNFNFCHCPAKLKVMNMTIDYILAASEPSCSHLKYEKHLHIHLMLYKLVTVITPTGLAERFCHNTSNRQ